MIAIRKVLGQKLLYDNHYEAVLSCGHTRTVMGHPQQTRCYACEIKKPASTSEGRQRRGIVLKQNGDRP